MSSFQKDFFDLVPAENYDVVVMAMVVNCVPSPELRGLMLLLSNLHLKMGGHYIIALPRRCLVRFENVGAYTLHLSDRMEQVIS